MYRPLKAVLVDSETAEAKIIEVEDDNDEFYRLLNCSLIDIVVRRIGPKTSNKWFNFICDDEGLFQSEPKISAIGNFGNVQFVGSLLIVGLTDDEGNLTSLADDEAKYILKFCQKPPTRMHPEGLMIVNQVGNE